MNRTKSIREIPELKRVPPKISSMFWLLTEDESAEELTDNAIKKTVKRLKMIFAAFAALFAVSLFTDADPDILLLGLLLAALTYVSRFSELEKELKKRRDEFESEFPDMVLQMILYLNSGLVFDSAFSRLLAEHAQSENILYRLFGEIKQRSVKLNMPLSFELYELARKSANKDFLRFATLAAEHVARGTELTDKLDKERVRLWNEKLGRAKAKGKELDTKLCFPLMLLMTALIVICAAPALLQMKI